MDGRGWRDAYVAEARKAEEEAGPKAITALRRPVLAAWAANLLARQQPQEAESCLALGENLREVHRALDAGRLRAASRRQYQLVTALARTAAGLARTAGQPVSDTVPHESEQAQRDGDTKPSSYAMMTSCTRSRAASLASSRLT